MCGREYVFQGWYSHSQWWAKRCLWDATLPLKWCIGLMPECCNSTCIFKARTLVLRDTTFTRTKRQNSCKYQELRAKPMYLLHWVVICLHCFYILTSRATGKKSLPAVALCQTVKLYNIHSTQHKHTKLALRNKQLIETSNS